MKKKILISTGGSGGHVIPAKILIDHLNYNFEVIISTDQRGEKFLNDVSNKKIRINKIFFVKICKLFIKIKYFIKYFVHK